MEVYLILADGKSVHTLKWVKELHKYFKIIIISFNSFLSEIIEIVGKENCIDLWCDIHSAGGNWRVLWNSLRVKDIIVSKQPKYINAHYITSYGTVAVIASILGGYKGKIILSTWGTDILVTPWKNKMYYFLTRYILRKSFLITSDSVYMTKKICDIYRKANVMTFPFGIEFYPIVSYQEKDKALFFSNRGLELNYNVDRIIEIFSCLYKKGKARKLYIANDGSERKKLERLVEHLDISEAVVFVGFLSADEQAEYYRKCQFYFSVPSSDSTSVSLLEAMSYGCIPIVSRIPANCEWIEDGVNGIFIEDMLEEDSFDNLQCESVFYANRNKILERGLWNKNIYGYINKLVH